MEIGGRGLRRCGDDGVDGLDEAAGFVGGEAVVTDRLLAFGWDVVDGGGEEVGGFEDFEGAFGVPTAAGAVNDRARFAWQTAALTKRTERVEKTGRKTPLIIADFQRLTQRTVKFIRWLRSFFWQNRPLDELPPILKKRYASL